MDDQPSSFQSYKSRVSIVFIGVFISCLLLFGIRWLGSGVGDVEMWGREARYVVENNPKEFDFLGAYAYPGTPIIEGAIILHKLFNISYNQGVTIFVIIFNSLVIAGVCAMCIILRRDGLWWLAVLGTLSLNSLYKYSTPPSAVVAVLLVLLFLLTIYIYENGERSRPLYLTLWSITAGLAIVTRVDISFFCFIIFLFLLLRSIGWKKIGLLTVGAFLTFIALDPFMWYMPFQHIKDLIFKIMYHYSDIASIHVSYVSIALVSSLAFVSMFLAASFVFLRKRLISPVRPTILVVLFFMTVGLYAIFLTSRFQTIRYYLPIIFIWETLLPLFLFSLVERMELISHEMPEAKDVIRRNIDISIILMICIYHIIFM